MMTATVDVNMMEAAVCRHWAITDAVAGFVS
jgi:hypothetical protein